MQFKTILFYDYFLYVTPPLCDHADFSCHSKIFLVSLECASTQNIIMGMKNGNTQFIKDVIYE